MKKIAALLLLATCICNGQATPASIGPSSYEVQMLPASPMMAELGKYGNTPLNKYNGTANINVPIHNINLDGLSIPLVLRYNTGGIRVNQDASWVGLGWNLSEGITITREINGFDDLRNTDYSETIVPNSSGHDNLGWIYSPNYLYETNSGDYKISGDNLLSMDHKNWMNNNPIDFEPDLFSLNTPGGACKFYLPKKTNSTILTGKVVNNVNFKIFYDSENFTFQVIDPDGFTYNFNAYELSTGYSNWDTPNAESREGAIVGVTSWSINQTKYTITAWRPTKIKSPMGRVLNFAYEQGLHYSYPSYSESYKFPVYPAPNNTNGWYEPKEINMPGPNSVSASINAFHNLYLTNISGDFGQVQFNLGDERLDLFSTDTFHEITGGFWLPTISPNTFNAKRLLSIDVKDPLDNIVKKAIFDYSYFNEDDLNNPVKEKYLRLKLNKVSINGKEKYEFSYFECDFLPPKDSKAIDFWGFYNGAELNEHTIPSSNRFYYCPPTGQNGGIGHEQFYKLNGANRKSDAYFAQYGLLDKVKYPTKGLTEFKYESNTVNLKKKVYTIQQLPFPGGKGSSLNSSESYSFAYQYLKLQDDPTYSLYDQQSQFDPGEHEDFKVGGLRVAEIVDYDHIGNRVNHREFEYSMPAPNMEQVRSSGVLMDDLVFHSKGLGSTWEYTPEVYGEGSTYARIHSNNIIRTSPSATGSHVGYSQVVEQKIEQGGADIGYTETIFKNESNQRISRLIGCTPQFWGINGGPDCQGNYECWDDISTCSDYAQFGYLYDNVFYGDVYINGAMPKTYEHSNGRVVNETIYNSQGAKVNESLYGYDEVARPGNIAPYYPIMNWSQAAISFPLGHPYEVINGDDFGVNKEYRLSQVVTNEYFDDGGAAENTTDYFYGEHNQLTKMVSKNSKGEIQTTKAYYPQDLMEDPTMVKLMAVNRTRIKIKSEVLEGTEIEPEKELLLSQKTTFSNDLNSTGILLPEKVMTRKGKPSDNEEETRQVYDRYNAYGNLLQYHKEDGIPISFIWGYDHQYVVAEVKNAAYAEIESVLGLDFDLGSGGLTEGQMTSLRNNLSTAFITTYEHKPLIGVSETTDPRGYTTYYSYNKSNRLETIKDNQSNILKDYQYSFVEDNTPLGCTDLKGNPLPPLTIQEGATDRGANYFTFRIIASGGTGAYTYEWYRGIGSSDTEFEDVIASHIDELVLDVNCDQTQYVKVIVYSGNLKSEQVYVNGNNPCLDGEDPNANQNE